MRKVPRERRHWCTVPGRKNADAKEDIRWISSFAQNRCELLKTTTGMLTRLVVAGSPLALLAGGVHQPADEGFQHLRRIIE